MDPSYADLVTEVMQARRIDSRYGPAREVQAVQVRITPGEVPIRKSLRREIGYMEGLQLIATTFDHGAFARVAPSAQLDLFTENGAYGPRISTQLPLMLEAMIADLGSRQHVLYIGHSRDQYRSDTPCTNSMQFLARDGALSCHVSMRSWDLIKGLPYDLMMFGMLTQVVAGCLDLEPLDVTVTAGSGHVYDADEARAPEVQTPGRQPARLLAGVPHLSHPDDAIHERLAKYRAWALRSIAEAPWSRAHPPGVVEVLG